MVSLICPRIERLSSRVFCFAVISARASKADTTSKYLHIEVSSIISQYNYFWGHSVRCRWKCGFNDYCLSFKLLKSTAALIGLHFVFVGLEKCKLSSQKIWIYFLEKPWTCMPACILLLRARYGLTNKILGAFPNANALLISPRVILSRVLTFDHPWSYNC